MTESRRAQGMLSSVQCTGPAATGPLIRLRNARSALCHRHPQPHTVTECSSRNCSSRPAWRVQVVAVTMCGRRGDAIRRSWLIGTR